MQAAISAVNQELVGGLQSQDKLPQLMSHIHVLLRHQKPAKADIPPGTVSSIANVLLASSTDAPLALTALKCLQQVAQLLGHAAATVLRLEGGLRALLFVLQSASLECALASSCVQLLGQLAATSNVALSIMVDVGALPTLVHLLELHGSHEPLAAAVLELLVHASKTPKAAAKLAEQHALVPTLGNVFAANEPSSCVCNAVVKCLRRLAKQPPCRRMLADAVPVLLSAAWRMASVAGQQHQVKRACRAIWLLKASSCLPALPVMEPSWLLPGRSAPHRNLASAVGADVERLQQLFPELQAALNSSQAAAAAAQAQATVNPAADLLQAVNYQPAAIETVTAANSALNASDYATSGQLMSGTSMSPATAAAGGGLVPVRGLSSKADSIANRQESSKMTTAGEEGTVSDKLPKLGWELRLRPRAVAEIIDSGKQQANTGVAGTEAFHTGGEHLMVQNMLHDLARLQTSQQPKHAVVYDSVKPPAACLTNDVSQTCLSSSSSGSSIGCHSSCSSNQVVHAVPLVDSSDAYTVDSGRVSKTSNIRTEFASGPMSRATTTSRQPQHQWCCTAGAAAAGSAGARAAVDQGVLQFDSHFESANLRMAVQVQQHEYDLFMSSDLNDRCGNSNSTQWFYFAVWNALPGVTYKLNLVNFFKPSSLYSSCKRPLMCCCTSPKQSARSGAVSAAEQDYQGPTCAAPAPSAGSGQRHAADRYHDDDDAMCCGAVQCTATHDVGSPSNGWFRAGHSIAYYASPYRGRSVPAAVHSICNSTNSGGPTAVDRGNSSGTSAGGHRSSRSISPSRRHKASAPPKTATQKQSAAAGPNAVRQSSHGHHSSSGRSHSTRMQTAEAAHTTATAGSRTSVCSTRRATIDAVGAGSALSNSLLRPRRATADTAAKAASQSSTTELQPTCSSSTCAAAASSTTATAVIENPAGPGLYCLTFSLEFPCSGMYLICSCYPYTYSDLQQQLAALLLRCSLRLIPGQASPVVRSLLCYTLAGQRCDMLTITDFNAGAAELAMREYVVITARVHPGETCSSWIAQGAIDFLVSNSPVALRLRRYFVFKVVPMLNPDGVVVGNYRSNLAGVDLNRQWDKANQHLHPTIFHARQLLEALVKAGRLALTIDIHGHSSALDAFFYGCEPLLAKPTAAERKEMRAAAAAAGMAAPASTSVPAAAKMDCCTDGEVQLMPAAGDNNNGPDGCNSIEQAVQPSASCAADAAPVRLNSGGTCGCSMYDAGSTCCDPPGQDAAVQHATVQHAAEAGLPEAHDVTGAAAAHCAAAWHAAWHVQGGVHSDAAPSLQAKPIPQQQQQQPDCSWVPAAADTVSTVPSLSAASIARLRVRMLPFLASQTYSGFSFSKSHFTIEKNRAGTARVVAARQLGVPGAYTLEASLAGCSTTQCHFTAKQYLELGESLMAAVGQLAEADDQALLGQVAGSIKLAALPGHPESGSIM